MHWGKGYRNSGISCLFNYEQALAHFHAVKPIRGREIECRPLGHRDRPHFSIRLNEQQEVECCEYNHQPAVTFRPNGEVWIKPSWVSISACSFIEEVLGVGSYQSDYKVLVRLGAGVFNASTKEGLVIKRGGAPNYHYEPLGVKPKVVHHIRRREANIVRAQYAEIVNYAQEYFKLDSTMPSHEDLREIFGVRTSIITFSDGSTCDFEHLNNPKWDYSDPEDIEQFIEMMRSDDPMDQYKAIVALRIQMGSWRSDKQHHKEVLQWIDRMVLSKHKHEVFKEVEVPAGVMRKDAYSWAFD